MTLPVSLDELWVLLRLAVAGLLAAVVGWDRERRERAAGLRTHVVVGVASCLFVSLATALVPRYAGHGSAQIDPSRVLGALVTGVAFVGVAAVVVKGPQRVHGLTTAMSLLATSAIGAAVAMEVYLVAVGTTLILFGVLAVLQRLESRREEDRADDGQSPPRHDEDA